MQHYNDIHVAGKHDPSSRQSPSCGPTVARTSIPGPTVDLSASPRALPAMTNAVFARNTLYPDR